MIEKAVAILRQGGLVAFATETVYGLGADATNPTAVARIFQAKTRPPTNPLIVHVADLHAARRYTIGWTPLAQELASHFWPGPLTLVLPRSPVIVDSVTAGLATVGLRVPNHPLALQLLKAFDGAIAAPSANRANHISPTQAQHVLQELGDKVDLVLDGGPCSVGIESTVIDLSTPHPIILRPGGISREQIESVIGPVNLFAGSAPAQTAAQSPGQHVRHYSPVTPAYRFEKSERADLLRQVIGTVLLIGPDDAHQIHMPDDPVLYARQIYQVLRDVDGQKPPAIFVEMPPDTPPWASVRDRLLRATTPWLSDSAR